MPVPVCVCVSAVVIMLLQLAAHVTPPYAIRADLKRLQLSQETFGTRWGARLLICVPFHAAVQCPGSGAK